jgi:hypothetical protein
MRYADELKVDGRDRTFFTISLFTEGATEKALQFILPLKSIYIYNFGLIKQKMYF